MPILAGNVSYTQCQLAYIWEQAGGSAQLAPVMAAVAMAESSGQSANYNGTCCYGLWQINANSDASGPGNWTDPMTNARRAVALAGNSLSGVAQNWCTYTNGSYLNYYRGNENIQPCQAPLNGTGAAINTAGQTQTGQPTTTAACQCGVLDWLGVQDSCGGGPLGCLVNSGKGAAEGIAADVIKSIMGSVINPLIQWVAGGAGILAGVTLVGSGVYLIVRASKDQSQRRPSIAGRAAQAGMAAVPGVGEAEMGEMAAANTAQRVGGTAARGGPVGRRSVPSSRPPTQAPETGQGQRGITQAELRSRAAQFARAS